MAAKIHVKVGDIEVDFEGPESFLDKKLPEFIAKLSGFAEAPATHPHQQHAPKTKHAGGSTTLAAFLKDSKATSKTKKFLATAQWLHNKGSELVATGEVVKAISDAHQSSVGNASQCLNTNVKSGYCEKTKDGKKFYVTDEGRATLN